MSYMPRAGWAGGMFSASKLYQSVSASGPSATVKPMPTKTSSSSARAWVTRCRWPRAGGERTWAGITSVRSRRSARSASARSASASSARRAGQLGLEPGPDLVQPAAGLLACLGIEAAQGAVGPGQRGALAEELGLDLCQGLGRRARPRWPARRRRRCRRCRDPRCQSPCRALSPSGDATCPGAPTPALAERLEADDGAGHAHVERLGPPRHRDGERPRRARRTGPGRARTDSLPRKSAVGTDQSSPA